jgi:DNA-binding NarL/FixJ family response regulator
MAPIRVFLVDDSLEFLRFTRDLLRELGGFDVVGSATSAESAWEPIERLQPGLVLIDLSMHGMNGLEATRLLKQKPNPPRVVLVTGDDNVEFRQAADAALADGFLAKSNLLQALGPLVSALFRNCPGNDEGHQPC